MPSSPLPRPDRPVVGVGAVVIRGDCVLLVRRGKEPLRGRWVIPGGTVELGETLEQAVVREVDEETGIRVRPRDVVLVFDRIHREGGAVSYHYVIVDYVCDDLGGEPRAGSDAEAAAFVARQDLAAYDVPLPVVELVVRAFALKDSGRRSGIAVSGPEGVP